MKTSPNKSCSIEDPPIELFHSAGQASNQKIRCKCDSGIYVSRSFHYYFKRIALAIKRMITIHLPIRVKFYT